MAYTVNTGKMRPLERALAIISSKEVFFAAIALSIMFVVKNELPTMATDMVKIYYSEQFLERLDPDEIIFGVLHELMHILLKHGLRRNGRDPELWNVACDHKINLTLAGMGYKLIRHPEWIDFGPTGFVLHCDPRFKGMSEEQVYDVLERERAEKAKSGQGKGEGQPAPGQSGQGKGQPAPGQSGMDGDILDVPVASDAEATKIGDNIDRIVATAATAAKQLGKMPAALSFLIKEYFEPQISWQTLLKRFAAKFVNTRSSWLVKNRRFPNVYLPGRHNKQIGEVTIIGDSSGSMFDTKIFKFVGSEINGIIKQVKPALVRVVWADDKDCSNQEEFLPGQDVVLNPKGGGGTDMRKPLEFIKKYNPRFAILITDGVTPWPSSKTPYPLIICCTTSRKCPDWAMVVRVTIPA
jgi:predicted metal-dependent peptidase